MSIKIIYFVHGTTYDNAAKVCSGWKDVKLNEKGIERAKNLGIVRKDTHMDMIFTSDLSRAIDSAELAFPNVPKIADKRLRECNYGEIEGQNKNLVRYVDHIREPFPEGESLIDVEKRMRDFIQFLEENYDGKTIGIVAHRATQLALEVITKNISWDIAIKNDWRENGNWQPGWEYTVGKN